MYQVWGGDELLLFLRSPVACLEDERLAAGLSF